MRKPRILHEDKVILVLDKPAGWVVNRSQTVKEETLQDWLEKNFQLKNTSVEEFYKRSGIVHRLDKETSGVILVAKTIEAFENLQKQFKERLVKKRYLALAHGKVEPTSGTIRAPISRSPFDRKKFGVFLGGREAETKYKVLSIKYEVLRGKKSFYSLLELEPKTGRTHQIRVHLKYIGHPVVGDEFYAGRKTAREDRRWCPRQFLHASFLSFTHPQTEHQVEFTSPLPFELKKALEALQR